MEYPHFLIGNTSWKGLFSIATLDYQSVEILSRRLVGFNQICFKKLPGSLMKFIQFDYYFKGVGWDHQLLGGSSQLVSS